MHLKLALGSNTQCLLTVSSASHHNNDYCHQRDDSASHSEIDVPEAALMRQ